MHRTLIDWCDYTWNPVWGCRNGCSYCYARTLAHRWGKSFEPHWMPDNFNSPMPRRPSRIFVNSMSDVSCWRQDWWDAVLGRIDKNPQYRFFFLTKNPATYQGRPYPSNCRLGITATRQREISEALEYEPVFLNIEPILESIDVNALCGHGLSWVILGAETGNRRAYGFEIKKNFYRDALTKVLPSSQPKFSWMGTQAMPQEMGL